MGLIVPSHSLNPYSGNGVLSSDVAVAGTFTTGYGPGKDKGSYFLSMGHKLTLGQATLYYPVDFDLTLGSGPAGTITVTNKTAATWPAGSTWRLDLQERGERTQLDVPLQNPNAATSTVGGSTLSVNNRFAIIPNVTESYLDLITLGAPIALDADGICAAQAISGLAVTAVINGSLATSGYVLIDQPRALQVLSSNNADNSQIVTASGLDVYGYSMSENIALSGSTAVLGLKAFKRVNRVMVSNTMAGNLTVGTTDRLGLPVFVPSAGSVIGEFRDGNNVGGAMTRQVPFTIGQTELLAPVTLQIASPVSGFITRAVGIVNGQTIVTGGNIGFTVGGVAVTGLTLVFGGTAVPGTVVSDTPTTPFSSTTAVNIGSSIGIVPDASFATSGAVNGFVEVTGLSGGVLVAGIRTAGGSTVTTGDVRGTYTPTVATDGSTVFDLLVRVDQRYPGIQQA